MIRKYLLIGKQIQLSSTKHDMLREDGATHPIEIKVPVETYWQAEELIKRAEYQLASGDDSQNVKETYLKVLKLLAPHCTSEKDRILIYDKIN